MAWRCLLRGRECCEWFCGRIVGLICGDGRISCSPHLQFDVKRKGTWNNPSTFPTIATCLWTIAPDNKNYPWKWCSPWTVDLSTIVQLEELACWSSQVVGSSPWLVLDDLDGEEKRT